MHGYIKLHRAINDWEWKTEPYTLAVFIHLLVNACFKEYKWKGITLKPGQLLIGRDAISTQTGVSVRSVRTALERLQATNEVTIKTTRQGTLVTIVNWALYQSKGETPTNEATNKTTGYRPAKNAKMRKTPASKTTNDENRQTLPAQRVHNISGVIATNETTNENPSKRPESDQYRRMYEESSLLREKDNNGLLSEDEMDSMRERQQKLNQCYDTLATIGLNAESDRMKCDQLASYYPAEWILEAIERTSEASPSARRWPYIKTILTNFQQSGGITDGSRRQPKPQKTAAQLREEARSERILRGEYDQPAHV